eukprot:3247378-Pleurochrysis_carterae.AAC.1
MLACRLSGCRHAPFDETTTHAVVMAHTPGARKHAQEDTGSATRAPKHQMTSAVAKLSEAKRGSCEEDASIRLARHRACERAALPRG